MKAREGVKSLDRSPEELPGVRGAERWDGGNGNLGDPPRPGGSAKKHRSVAPYNRCETGKWAGAGSESEAAVLPLEPTGQHNPLAREGPLLRSCVTHREGPVSARWL